MLYFAYGSNMQTEEIHRQEKCPGAVFTGTGYLINRKLVFNKKSTKWGRAANIESSYGDTVYGVVYDLTVDEESSKLDNSEGGCHRIDVKVRMLPDRRLVDGFTYEADQDMITSEGAVKQEYIDLLVDGAKEHGLPDEYVVCLKRYGQESCSMT